MKRFAYALATVAALGLAAPAYAFDASPMRVAQADVKVKVRSGDGPSIKKKVVIKKKAPAKKIVIKKKYSGDYAMAKKKVIIKKKNPSGTTVIKKKIEG